MTRTARNLARGGTVSLLLAATNSRFGVCSAVALLATVCVLVSASALSTTPTQDFTLAVPSTGFSGGNLIFDTSTITPLNPALGTLISVTYTLNGNINRDVKGLSGGTDSLDIAFLSLNTGATATTTGAVSIPISFSATTTSPNGDLSIFEGTGRSVNFEGLGVSDTDADGGNTAGALNTVASATPLTGTIAYNYAVPVAATPLPATLPLFGTGLGALGLLEAQSARKFVRGGVTI